MPLIKSAIKKMRQDKVRTARNRLKREHLRDTIKAVEDAAKAGAANISDLLKVAFKTIDKSAKWNLLHSNNAARKKSKLNRIAKIAATEPKKAAPAKKAAAAKKAPAKAE